MKVGVLRNNRRLTALHLLITVTLLLALPSQVFSQQSSGKTLRVAIDPEFAPFSGEVVGNRSSGFIPDVLANLEMRTTHQFNLVNAPEGVELALESNHVDFGVMPKLDSLAHDLVTSGPICHIQYGIFSMSDKLVISGPGSLKNLRTGYCSMDLAGEDLNRLEPDADAIQFNSRLRMLRALVQGDIDAAVTAEIAGERLMAEVLHTDRIAVHRAVLSKQLCLVGTMDNSEIISELDGEIPELLKSTGYTEMIRRHLEPEGAPGWFAQNWYFMFLATWPIALIILATWLLNRTLNRVVKERTGLLEQSEQRYRMLVEDSPDGILVTDSVGNILNCSRNECRLLGYELEDLMGNHVRMIMSDAAAADFSDKLKQIVEGTSVENNVRLVCRDGSMVEVWRKGVPMFDKFGRFAGAVFYDRDLTERRKMERKLYRERDFINAVVDTSGALVMVLDNQAGIVRVNPAFERASGYSIAEVQGQAPWQILLPESAIEQSRMHFYEVMAGQWPKDFEEIWIAKDGQQRIIRWTYTVIVGGDNTVSFVVGTGIDLTERRLTESTLAETQRQHEQVINTTSEGFWLVDAHNITLDINDSFCRMLGFSRRELIGKSAYDLIHPASRLELDKQTALTSATSHRSYELELIRRDGSVIPVAVESSTLKSDGGHISSFAFVRDISRQKDYEIALQRSEELHRRMFQSNEAVHLLLDAETTQIVDANESALEFLGHDTLAQDDATLASLAAMDDEQFIRITRRIAQDGTGQLFFKIRTADGDRREVESHLSRIDSGDRMLLYAIVLDVTNRRRAEERLRRNEERLKAIFNNAAIGISLVSRTGHYIQFNDTWCVMTGYNPEELYAMGPEDITHPDDRARTAEEIKATLDGTKASYRMQMRYVRKNGSFFWADLSVSVIRNPMGGVEAILGVVTDITDSKQGEQERERLIEDLSRAALEIKTLKGLLPICASCKKIRDDSGYWQQIEGYVKEHSEANFTHSICPDCAEEMYPNLKQ